MTKKTSLQKQKVNKPSTAAGDILDDLREMIKKTREFVASTVNSSLTLLYWHVGNRIHSEILQEERAEYGRLIIVSLSKQLVLEYGNGFNSKNLNRMVQFSEIFPNEQIVVSLTRQLSWTHFVTLIPIRILFSCQTEAYYSRWRRFPYRPSLDHARRRLEYLAGDA